MLAIEIGFGDVKVVGEGVKFKFPTVVAYGGSGVLRGYEDGDKCFFYNGKQYLVGKDALGHPDMFSSRTPEFLINYAPLFLYKAFEEAGGIPDRVALGLVVGYFSSKDKLMRKVSSFEINGRGIEMPNCSVYAQAAGIWVDWSAGNPFVTAGNYMVVDVGFNTLDVLFIKNGKISKEGSWMLEGEGVVKLANKLSDLIQQKVGVGLAPHRAKELLERKRIMVYGKEKSLEKAVKRLSADYSNRVFSQLESRCGEEFNNVHGIIVGGGGAYYIAETLPKKLRGLIHIVEEPEFANARGFYKAIKKKYGDNSYENQSVQGG